MCICRHAGPEKSFEILPINSTKLVTIMNAVLVIIEELPNAL